MPAPDSPLSPKMIQALLAAHADPTGLVPRGAPTAYGLIHRKVAEGRREPYTDRKGRPGLRFRVYLTPAGHTMAEEIIARGSPVTDPDRPTPITITFQVDPTDLRPGDTVVKINDHDLDGCHCDVIVTVRRAVQPAYPHRVTIDGDHPMTDPAQGNESVTRVHAAPAPGNPTACGTPLTFGHAATRLPDDTPVNCPPCTAVLDALRRRANALRTP